MEHRKGVASTYRGRHRRALAARRGSSVARARAEQGAERGGAEGQARARAFSASSPPICSLRACPPRRPPMVPPTCARGRRQVGAPRRRAARECMRLTPLTSPAAPPPPPPLACARRPPPSARPPRARQKPCQTSPAGRACCFRLARVLWAVARAMAVCAADAPPLHHAERVARGACRPALVPALQADGGCAAAHGRRRSPARSPHCGPGRGRGAGAVWAPRGRRAAGVTAADAALPRLAAPGRRKAPRAVDQAPNSPLTASGPGRQRSRPPWPFRKLRGCGRGECSARKDGVDSWTSKAAGMIVKRGAEGTG